MANPAPKDEASKETTRLRTRLLSALLVVVCSAMVLEGATRMLLADVQNPAWGAVVRQYTSLARQDTSNFRFVPDLQLAYRLTPGFSAPSSDGGPGTRHNLMGFRDDFVDKPKSPGTVRIICLGGSTTYGVSVSNNNETYPAFLEGFLNNGFDPNRWDQVEVFNLGVGGYTSREVLTNLTRYGVPLDPDVIVIQSAINDVAPRFYDDFRCDYRHFRKTMTPLTPNFFQRAAYRSRFLLFAGWQLGFVAPLTLQSRTQNPMPAPEEASQNLSTNGPECYRRNLEEAINLAEKNGIEVWLLSQVYLNASVFKAPTPELRLLDEAYQKGLSEHNEVIRALCESTSAQLVDLDRLMPKRLTLFKDPIHMVAPGNREKAKIIARVMGGSGSRL